MATILKAKEAAERIYDDVRSRAQALKATGIQPQLDVILVEGDPASAYYAQAKRKIADRLGIAYRLHELPADATEASLLQLIAECNAVPAVHGILLELPLPAHLSARRIERAIAPAKDVDGVSPANKLAVVTGEPGLYPATPQACIALVKHYGYALEGADVTLIGRGQTVGLPLFHLLQREQATVTVCHSRTPDIAKHLARAAFAFVAVGRPDTVTPSMIHPGLVLADAGINELADGSIAGDVAAGAGELAAAYSPVPGGVGTLTTAIVFRNLMEAIDWQQKEATVE
ncbi:bifunctional 5,10-methylenetetrahydrofolate dehydrogenase/5,10-methenyltetrahydrofolate cyclohydrolase [Cohnella rhizosphaerae]|uniref:Bifunctional protein FolD n=1 Tax=Cohnella rhizosphaerae TaxID=1457232 RepID=A0A9X4QT57_9BACL|nr:bifunctional 5,10-methylenetetrahydrofolate dehydrogenase/5,10-methenyltetrahydrofolate cyclohydrolase [Cohnella rhizosphaerae]MDG0810776.1 bifunctional 5,10-methylenetetrahydrofolate dehydrogenase/5,10-methenyltetrahydrofolate cyclohydrolase [Cohnella rhizosphaerae]